MLVHEFIEAHQLLYKAGHSLLPSVGHVVKQQDG